jgi:enamine deaminase RidA (YjgF/YER057c/UK114 family)
MRTRNVVATLSLLGLLGLLALGAGGGRRQYIEPSTPDGDGLPFSGGVMVGKTLYLSGALGLKDGKVPDDPATEARILLDRYKSRLATVGMTMDDLVSVQVFCSDVAHYDVWNRVYRTYFTKEFPARAFVGSGTLLRGARFEMQAIAVKR